MRTIILVLTVFLLLFAIGCSRNADVISPQHTSQDTNNPPLQNSTVGDAFGDLNDIQPPSIPE